VLRNLKITGSKLALQNPRYTYGTSLSWLFLVFKDAILRIFNATNAYRKEAFQAPNPFWEGHLEQWNFATLTVKVAHVFVISVKIGGECRACSLPGLPIQVKRAGRLITISVA